MYVPVCQAAMALLRSLELARAAEGQTLILLWSLPERPLRLLARSALNGLVRDSIR